MAVKGNRFAAGCTTSGRPPIYDNIADMMLKAEEYFVMETTASGMCKPTISGLIFHLGFGSRQSWYSYKVRNNEFKDGIERLVLFIESCYEKNLHGFAWAGSAFALKNINAAEWKDEVTQNQNQVLTTVNIETVDSLIPLASSENEIR